MIETCDYCDQTLEGPSFAIVYGASACSPRCMWALSDLLDGVSPDVVREEWSLYYDRD